MSVTVGRQSVVVGLDGSAMASNALRWAADLADRYQAPITLATAVIEAAYYFTGEVFLTFPEATDQLRVEGKTRLSEAEDFVRQRYPDMPVTTTLGHGPADLLLGELSNHARMVVVGAHGRSAVSSWLVGSTALLLANHARCPVAVWRGEVDKPLQQQLPVVVGVDGSALSMQAVGRAYEFAAMYDVPLVAVHACGQWPTPGTGADDALLSESLAGLSAEYPDVPVERIVRDTGSAQALIDAARTAQLVVVGSHGRGRAMGTLLGSTSQNLLHHSPVPVVICRDV